MATLISRASGDFTAAGTWALCSVAAELDTVALAVTVTTSNQDSTAFVLAAQEVDAVAIHVSVIPVNVSGTVTIILRNSTTATNIFTTIIDTQDLQFKDGTARGWIFVSDGTTHTPNGTDSYVIRVIRTGGSGTMSFFAASGTNWARQVRRTATAAPGTNDKLIIAGIFTGVGLNTRHTVTLDNTATTTFGPAVGANSRSITVNDKGTLQLASGSGVNYYFRWIGDFIIYAGGQVLLDNPTVASGTITGITSRGWSGRIINTTNATPIVVTSPGHGLSTGDVVRIWGNPGNTAAEGTFQITVLTASTFSLQDVTGANVAGNGDQKYPGIPTGTWHAPLVVTDVAHGLTTGDIILINNDIVCTQQVYHGAFGPHQITTWGADKFFLNSASHATNSNYTSGGTWTKRGPLVSTSTLTLDPFCNVANNDAGISVWGGGVFLSIGTPKKSITRMLEQTVIGSDTVSLNSVVDTTNVANSVVTWKEGRKFDPAWTGTIDINGTSRTITGAVTATSLTINSNAGALTGVTAAKTGTGAQLTLQIEDTTGWQVGDMMAIQSSGKGSWSSGTTIASVDSATQVTLSTAANTYASGLNDVNGDMRAYVANGTRNIQVRSTVAFAYYLTLWNQPSARYRFLAQDTVFRNIGSGTGNARGIQLTTNVDGASCYLLNCVLRDCGSSGYFLFQTSANNLAAMFPYVENTSFLNPSPNAGSISGGGCTNSQANAYFVGNFFTTSVVTGMSVTQIALTAHTNMIYTDNVHAGGAAGSSNSGYLSFTASGGGAFPVFCRNQFMGGGGGYISGVGFLNGGGPWAGLFGSGDWANRNRIVRTSGGSGQIAMNFSSGASFTTSTHNRVQFDGFELIACGWNWGGSSLQVGMDGECYLSNFTIDAGSNIFPTVGANAITFISRGSSPVLDGCEFGQKTSFGNDVGLGQASASFPGAVRPIFRNCKFGSANWCNPLIGNGVTAPTPDLFLGAISYRHNQTANLFSAYRAHRANYTANNTYTAGSLGRMDPDTVVFRTASPSLKIAPNATNGALSKLLSPTIRVPVTNGSTITPSVWVRKSSSGSGDSANYNGAQPQLILLADSSLGISTETVLATGSAAIGNWEELSATTQTFTSSGVAQLAVCLDGTTGFINIDDFSCPSVTTTTGFEFWGMESFGPMVNGEPPAGGGGSSIAFSPIGRHIG